MKILVLGVYYSNNLGDGVICECVADRLQKHFDKCTVEIEDVLNRSCFKREQENTIEQLEKRKKRQNIRHMVSKYTFWDKEYQSQIMRLELHKEHIHEVCNRPYDLVVFAGGQLFMDSYALILGEYVKCFSEKGVPVFMNGCGVGPQVSAGVRKAFKKTLNSESVKWISSRDDYEMMNDRFMNKEKKVRETYDPALWSTEVYNIQKDSSAEYVGLGIMFPHSIKTEMLISFWIELIKHFEEKKVPWKIFVNGDQNDILFAKYIFKQIDFLPGEFEEYLAPIPERPEQLVKLVAGFKSIVSFRLHSHIIAAALDVPSIAVVWDKKLNFFFDKIGYSERCCNVSGKVETILQKLQQAEKEGYDRQLIREQKTYADGLLYHAIQEEIKGF